MAEVAAQAIKFGLDLYITIPANSSAATPASTAAAAVRSLWGLSQTDTERIEVLTRATQMAGSPHMNAEYPAVEAHWLIAQAHNAACAAKGARLDVAAGKYMNAAVQLVKATKCKALSVYEFEARLEKWGLVQAAET